MGATDIETRDLLLSSEERFEIWNVKQEERPYLLLPPTKNQDEDVSAASSSICSLESSISEESLPLLDGCDIAGWRARQLVSVSSYINGVLNVGSGCSLMRKETQLPNVIIPKSFTKWQELRQKLLTKPRATAARLTKAETSKLKEHPWFEKDNVPAILEGCTDEWKAMETCSWANLVKKFGDYDWRFSDTHGACMTLETYSKYVHSIEGMTDDAPLAVYDSQLHIDERRCLLEDYEVPKCFDGFDLFQDVLCTDADDDNRCCQPPPYRWILMGPARSGTGLHIDPLGTHAWVTIVEGCKRWILFPPKTDPLEIGMQDPQIPSSIWFSSIYSKIMLDHPHAVEVLQKPGETVYVPAGWPHLVLNLTATVAITQNYATEYPCFHNLVESVREAEPELLDDWLPRLNKTRPDLVQALGTHAIKAIKATKSVED